MLRMCKELVVIEGLQNVQRVVALEAYTMGKGLGVTEGSDDVHGTGRVQLEE